MGAENQGNKQEAELHLKEGPDGSFEVRDTPHEEVDQAALDAAAAAAAAKQNKNDDDDDNDDDATGDDRQVRGGADDGTTDADEAAELEAAGTELERQRIRERRRVERLDRKNRRRNRETELRRELGARDRVIDELRNRVNVIENRSSGSELAQIDGRIRHEESTVEQLKNIIAEASAIQNGQAVADATVRMTEAIANRNELVRVRQAYAQRRAQPEPAQLDPRVVSNAQAWIERHSWYNPAGGDSDSRMVIMLDGQLAQEGYNPNTPQYWDELTDRVTKFLPHKAGRRADNSGGGDNSRYNAGASQRKPMRNVTSGSGREGAAQGSSTSFTLSPDRVKALQEAGHWDDPKARNEAIRRYRDYDAELKASSNPRS